MESELISKQIQNTYNQELSAQKVHLLDILIIFAGRWRLIFAMTVGTAILAVIVSFLLPSRYTAEAVIMPPAQNTSGSSVLNQLGGGTSALASMAGSSLGIKSTGDMYLAFLRTRTVEDATIGRFQLQAKYRTKNMMDTRKEFERRTVISLGAKDGLIRVDVVDRDPKQAADISNGYVEEFCRFSATIATTEASQRRLFFQRQLLDAHGSLAAAEDAMKNTEQHTGVLQVDAQARALIESAAILRGQVVAKEVELRSMQSFATPDNPQMVMASQQLSALKAQLAKLSGDGEGSSTDVIVPKGRIPGAVMEYVRRLRDVKYNETIVELLSRQFEMAKVDEARQGATIQVVDPAVPPDKRSFPKRGFVIMISTLMGFLTACGWCLAVAGLQHVKNDPEEKERLQALRDVLR